MSETKEKKGWRVSVRHSPLRKDHKSRVVQAANEAGAWAAYLRELEGLVNDKHYKTSTADGRKLLKDASDWFAAVKNGSIPTDAEILPDEYVARRREAIRVRGGVRKEDVGGFAELASA